MARGKYSGKKKRKKRKPDLKLNVIKTITSDEIAEGQWLVGANHLFYVALKDGPSYILNYFTKQGEPCGTGGGAFTLLFRNPDEIQVISNPLVGLFG